MRKFVFDTSSFIFLYSRTMWRGIFGCRRHIIGHYEKHLGYITFTFMFEYYSQAFGVTELPCFISKNN